MDSEAFRQWSLKAAGQFEATEADVDKALEVIVEIARAAG